VCHYVTAARRLGGVSAAMGSQAVRMVVSPRTDKVYAYTRSASRNRSGICTRARQARSECSAPTNFCVIQFSPCSYPAVIISASICC
jgi:hypothetical protein